MSTESKNENHDEKIYMLNALWFKADGGAALYRDYLRAAAPFSSPLGAKVLGPYVPDKSLIGDWDPDLFFVVEWPNKAAFMALVEDPGYQTKALPLREAAIEKSLLIRCKRPGDGFFS